MPNSKKLFSSKIFIDYKPAELRKNKEWIIVYYAKVPAKNELKRFRVRVAKLANYTERLRYAKKLERAINKKLEAGWSPFYEDATNTYKSISEVFDNYLTTIKKEVLDGVKRPDTIRSYTSYLKIIQEYLEKRQKNLKFLVELDIFIVNQFLDYVYLERNSSARTYNNYLRFLSALFSWSKSKGYIKTNPAENVRKKTTEKKTRSVLGFAEKQQLKEYGKTNQGYYTLCMCTYYAFIRRTELTKIKVSDVHLNKGFITIDSKISKNRKTENVTIPNNLYPLLIEHLKFAKNSDFLFSTNNFNAGKIQLTPKKVSDQWNRFRKAHGVGNIYQFYSLKDTGITDLLNSGIPAIKVRDQARHHDLKITESYTQRNATFDAIVKNADFVF